MLQLFLQLYIVLVKQLRWIDPGSFHYLLENPRGLWKLGGLMSGQVISVTIQFYSEKDIIAIPQVNEVVNRTIKSLSLELNSRDFEPTYSVKIWRKDG